MSKNKMHHGHSIEIKVLDKKTKPQLVIDSNVVRYGQFDDGMFFLYDYAYNPNKDLEQLAMDYVDYKDAVAKERSKRSEGKKGGTKE